MTQVVIELWQLILSLASVLVAFCILIWAFGTLLMRQFEKRLEERFAAHDAVLDNESRALRALERDILLIRAELPEKYVRREDYIRGQTVIEAKLDAISSELKLVQIQGAKRAN